MRKNKYAYLDVIEPTLKQHHIGKFNLDTNFLGKLCPYGHDYNNTGKSKRYISNKRCTVCTSSKEIKKTIKIQAECLPLLIAEAEQVTDYNRETQLIGKPCKKPGHTITGFDLSLRYKQQGRLKNLCVECSKERLAKYKTDNRDRYLSNRHKIYRTPESRAKRQAYLPVYRHRANEIAAMRRCQKRQAFPAWCDRAQIQPFYDHAILMTELTGEIYNVDHIEPLIHPLVCGLHVPANLRVITRFENYSKNNDFTPFVLSEKLDT